MYKEVSSALQRYYSVAPGSAEHSHLQSQLEAFKTSYPESLQFASTALKGQEAEALDVWFSSSVVEEWVRYHCSSSADLCEKRAEIIHALESAAKATFPAFVENGLVKTLFEFVKAGQRCGLSVEESIKPLEFLIELLCSSDTKRQHFGFKSSAQILQDLVTVKDGDMISQHRQVLDATVKSVILPTFFRIVEENIRRCCSSAESGAFELPLSEYWNAASSVQLGSASVHYIEQNLRLLFSLVCAVDWTGSAADDASANLLQTPFIHSVLFKLMWLGISRSYDFGTIALDIVIELVSKRFRPVNSQAFYGCVLDTLCHLLQVLSTADSEEEVAEKVLLLASVLISGHGPLIFLSSGTSAYLDTLLPALLAATQRVEICSADTLVVDIWSKILTIYCDRKQSSGRESIHTFISSYEAGFLSVAECLLGKVQASTKDSTVLSLDRSSDGTDGELSEFEEKLFPVLECCTQVCILFPERGIRSVVEGVVASACSRMLQERAVDEVSSHNLWVAVELAGKILDYVIAEDPIGCARIMYDCAMLLIEVLRMIVGDGSGPWWSDFRLWQNASNSCASILGFFQIGYQYIYSLKVYLSSNALPGDNQHCTTNGCESILGAVVETSAILILRFRKQFRSSKLLSTSCNVLSTACDVVGRDAMMENTIVRQIIDEAPGVLSSAGPARREFIHCMIHIFTCSGSRGAGADTGSNAPTSAQIQDFSVFMTNLLINRLNASLQQVETSMSEAFLAECTEACSCIADAMAFTFPNTLSRSAFTELVGPVFENSLDTLKLAMQSYGPSPLRSLLLRFIASYLDALLSLFKLSEVFLGVEMFVGFVELFICEWLSNGRGLTSLTNESSDNLDFAYMIVDRFLDIVLRAMEDPKGSFKKGIPLVVQLFRDQVEPLMSKETKYTSDIRQRLNTVVFAMLKHGWSYFFGSSVSSADVHPRDASVEGELKMLLSYLCARIRVGSGDEARSIVSDLKELDRSRNIFKKPYWVGSYGMDVILAILQTLVSDRKSVVLDEAVPFLFAICTYGHSSMLSKGLEVLAKDLATSDGQLQAFSGLIGGSTAPSDEPSFARWIDGMASDMCYFVSRRY